MYVRVPGYALKSSPVAEQDMSVRRQLLKNEPGLKTFGCLVQPLLDGEIQLAAFFSKPHTGQVVGNEPEALVPFQ